MKCTVGAFILVVMWILYASVGLSSCDKAPQITVEVASSTSVKIYAELIDCPLRTNCGGEYFRVEMRWGSHVNWYLWQLGDTDLHCTGWPCWNFYVFIDGLATGTTYQFRALVNRYDSDCYLVPTEWSGWATITVGPPNAPSIYAYPLDSDAVGIYWTDTSDNESGFRIQRQVEGEDFSTIATVPAGTTSYSDSGLSPNTTYCYRVVAYNAAGEAISNVYCVTTPNAPPAAPSELEARATASEIYLMWQDNSENEEGFIIERSQGGGPFSEIARVGANVTSYVDTELPSGVTFCYRVCAYNGEGNSDYSSQACATTRVPKPWTVVVYLAADNNLGGGSPSNSDFKDFDEIEKGLVASGDDVDVVVLWDKPGTNDTAIYWVQPDDNEGTLATYVLNENMWYIPPNWEFDYSNGWPKGADTPSEENMGDPETLTNFLNFVFYNFQSDHYALILWNHGGGWEPKSKKPPKHVEYMLENGETWKRTFWPPQKPLEKKEPVDRSKKPDPITRGVCWDDTNDDFLTIKEVAAGVEASSREFVENLGFDACLMQMLEVAYEMKDIAQYMTASEESEWGNGWAYHQIIAGITSSTTPLELAQLWGTTRARWEQGGLDTISSLDLSQIDQLATDVSALGDRLASLVSTEERYQEIMLAKLLSLCFAYNEFLDLDDLCYWIWALVDDTTVQNLAQTVRDDIASAVVAKANGPGYGEAGGISIYMPHYHDIRWGAPHGNYTADNFAFCADYNWDEFLNIWLASDYPDPYESNDAPDQAYDFSAWVDYPSVLYLFWEADFDDGTPDWYAIHVPFPCQLTVYAWCTEYYSDTVIYLYDSLENAQADNYFAYDDDGLYYDLGRNQLGSYLETSELPAGTYYLKVVPYGDYGEDEDYEVWIGVERVPTPAIFRIERETGSVLTDGSYYGSKFESGSADVAEWVPVSELVEPGDVLEIDPENPGYYRKARGPCSSLVAGVVSTAPGFVLGHGEDTEGKALLALMGIVPVKVTDEGGPILPGDLLVASSTPGYAMRWDPTSGIPCALVGKALEPFDEEYGMVLALLIGG